MEQFLTIIGLDTHYFQHDKEDMNCSIPAILEFPNIMRKKAISYTVISLFLSLYLFIMLAIVCDDYLVPAMERLCYSLHMSYDVAGATFLALATSAPELFVNCVGTFITEGDIGVGTIVGSSVFNVLAIPAVCGVFTNVSSQLDWWPITRDTAWYSLGIIALAVVLHDGLIKLIESIFLLLGYALNLIMLCYDRRIQKLFREMENEDALMTEDPMEREEEPLKSFREHIFSWPKEGTACTKTWWVITYPFDFLLAVTIPSVRFCFSGTMLVSIMWICIISYLDSWFLTIVGYNIGIPDSIMGMVVLAAGTSVPEAASSYIVTKKGYGSMAMGNAIGSNTVNIFLCLGLPWFLKTLIFQRDVIINSAGMYVTTLMLVFTVIILYGSLLCSKFELARMVGCICLISYIVFVILTSSVEMYFYVPMCNIESDEYAYLSKFFKFSFF